MIGKALLSGLWAHPEGCFTVRFTLALSHISSRFTVRLISFHHSRCDAALSLFASKWLLVSCYALSACAMWSRGSWLGGSLVSAWCFCCFTHPLVWPGDFDVLPFVSAAIPCRDDTMLSPLAWISPWTGTCHALFWRFGFVLLCFVLCWLVRFWFWCLPFVWWWLRDGLLDCTRVLYQFTLEATQSADGHVYALIKIET